ncbi:MAG TPA: hypothetical protein VN457_07960 [Chlamydiales bacterium]|nr:hypothetical protein [Chlamydiales bacterium]
MSTVAPSVAVGQTPIQAPIQIQITELPIPHPAPSSSSLRQVTQTVATQPSFPEAQIEMVQDFVLWLGRKIHHLYHFLEPHVKKVAEKAWLEIGVTILLQCLDIETRLIICLIALAGACIVTIAQRTEWISHRIFRPFLFSTALDFGRIVLFCATELPTPLDIIGALYYAFPMVASLYWGSIIHEDWTR